MFLSQNQHHLRLCHGVLFVDFIYFSLFLLLFWRTIGITSYFHFTLSPLLDHAHSYLSFKAFGLKDAVDFAGRGHEHVFNYRFRSRHTELLHVIQISIHCLHFQTFHPLICFCICLLLINSCKSNIYIQKRAWSMPNGPKYLNLSFEAIYLLPKFAHALGLLDRRLRALFCVRISLQQHILL